MCISKYFCLILIHSDTFSIYAWCQVMMSWNELINLCIKKNILYKYLLNIHYNQSPKYTRRELQQCWCRNPGPSSYSVLEGIRGQVETKPRKVGRIPSG